MRPLTPWIAVVLASACSTPPAQETKTQTAASPAADTAKGVVKEYHLTDLPDQEVNVQNDTLLVYTTHALGNGEFVMAARNVEETREGLRLVLYRPRPDSSAEVLAVSKPAYDSQVMLPTFFSTGDTADGIVILANYGALESWGQNAFWLKDGRFKELGWLDVTRREWKTRLDSLQQWRTAMAPFTKVTGHGGQFEFRFTTDSVQLFDDLRGHREVMLPAGHVMYRYDGSSMQLVVDGEAREAKPL